MFVLLDALFHWAELRPREPEGVAKMRRTSLLMLALLSSVALAGAFTVRPAAATTCILEAMELSYQVEHADRIVLGRVTGQTMQPVYTAVAFQVEAWLKAALPLGTITIRTPMGTQYAIAGAATFTDGEEVIVILKDIDAGRGIFEAPLCLGPKHPVNTQSTITDLVGEPPVRPLRETTSPVQALLALLMPIVAVAAGVAGFGIAAFVGRNASQPAK